MADKKNIVQNKLVFEGFLDSQLSRRTTIGIENMLLETWDFNKGDFVRVTIEKIPTRIFERGKNDK